jgi:hypothetical protein
MKIRHFGSLQRKEINLDHISKLHKQELSNLFLTIKYKKKSKCSISLAKPMVPHHKYHLAAYQNLKLLQLIE